MSLTASRLMGSDHHCSRLTGNPGVMKPKSSWTNGLGLIDTTGNLGGRQEVTHGVSLQTGLNLDPFMIHEMFLCLTETAFGSHPCRVVSFTAVTRVQIPSGTPL